MAGITIFEFDALTEAGPNGIETAAMRRVPKPVFRWLEREALRLAGGSQESWLRLTQRHGERAVQVTHFVGVLQAPDGFRIEILPKTGRDTTPERARGLLVRMLKCLIAFRHIRARDADLDIVAMPLLEVFIQEFLQATNMVVKRGLRRDYVARQENLYVLRGKVLVDRQIARNLVHRERFFTEHDEFLPDRAENRLIYTALRTVLKMSRSHDNQRLARRLGAAFAGVPVAMNTEHDIRRIRLDRSMAHYKPALEWAKLILRQLSPNPGPGRHPAPSLLFPMDALFEAYVAKHMARQLQTGWRIKAQASDRYLVMHMKQRWFRLKPDLLVKNRYGNRMVLDTKWKLLDAKKDNGREKYGLGQADFYQLYAYGRYYLGGRGDVVLIYPKTDSFSAPLPAFHVPDSEGMKLWVAPFCLESAELRFPEHESFSRLLRMESTA
ncbi:MAG TPA: McrC family protein [Gammaproteobacteria bacterium]|nr:McrC family protein [Gammaproteobacteria bacterium]